jgi:Bacterial sugar transferase
MKRLFDIIIAGIALSLASTFLLAVTFLIWRQDGFSPFYIAPRVGKDERPFQMVKLRSMIKNADKSGVDSTSKDDRPQQLNHHARRQDAVQPSVLEEAIKPPPHRGGLRRARRIHGQAPKAYRSMLHDQQHQPR